MKPTGSTPDPDKQESWDLVLLHKLLDTFGMILRIFVKRPPRIDKLTMRDVTRFFVENRPPKSHGVRGALMRQDHPDGVLITQVYLDTNDEVLCRRNKAPYGRKLIARSLDDELQEMFGEKKLLVFE